MTEELKKVYSAVFTEDSKEYVDYAFGRKYGADNALWHTEDGRVVSCLFYVERRLKIRDKVLPCPYIVGVGTLPEYRKRGLAELLMYRCFEVLREKGYIICALHPFRHSFYEKFGFVTYNRVKVHTVSCNGSLEYRLKDIGEGDMPQVKRLYDEFMAPYSGFAVRDIGETARRFEEFKSFANCKFILKGDKPIGYVYYEDSFAEEFCAPWQIADCIAELDGKQVYLPVESNLGEPVDFTMLKVLDREKLANEFNARDLSELDDVTLVRALTGSWGEFGTPLPDFARRKYLNLKNFVFDKY